MTAPRWIAEALDAACEGARHLLPDVRKEAIAKELVERLPLDSIEQALRGIQPGDWSGGVLAVIIGALTDDPEVVTLTELYQGASRMLDAAGVPYERALTDDGDPQVVRLNLAGRIQWLGEQRPTRLDLQRVEAERDAARDLARRRGDQLDAIALQFDAAKMDRTLPLPEQAQALQTAYHETVKRERATEALAEQRLLEINRLRTYEQEYGKAELLLNDRRVPLKLDGKHAAMRDRIAWMIHAHEIQIDGARTANVEATRERDQLRKMAAGAAANLDRERREHQEAEGAAANREIGLRTALEGARERIAALEGEVEILRESLDSATGDAEHHERELVDLRRRFDDLQRDRDRLARDLNHLQGDLDTAERKLRDAEREAQRARHPGSW